MKTVNVKLGYYQNGRGVTGKQLSYIQALLEKDYCDAYHHYITKYGTRNPYNRLNSANARKLIDGLLKKDIIIFIDRAYNMKTKLASIYKRLKSYFRLRLQVVYHKRYHLRPLLKITLMSKNYIINAYEL